MALNFNKSSLKWAELEKRVASAILPGAAPADARDLIADLEEFCQESRTE